MRTEILIATYSKDQSYLVHNLNSINQFARGFAGVTLIVPEQEVDEFEVFKAQPGLNICTYVRDPDSTKWQIHAQAVKCMADLWCPNADFVLHTDSDCIFTEPVTPEDYLVDGKPVLLMQKYANLPASFPWQSVTETVLGFPVEYEFMRRHPQVNPIGLYQELRTHIELTHEIPFERFVLAQKATFPWGFSEHNALGAYAYARQEWRDKYHWVDVDKDPRPKDKLIQFWSHSPPEKEQGTPFGLTLTPNDIFTKLKV